MEISELIDEQRVLLDVDADCTKAVFRCVSEVLEKIVHIPARTISSALAERERLGSTAVGEGISIPHARLDAVLHPQAFFLRLQKSIDMDALDDKPVDLFFILLVPAQADNDHLRVLSRIARIMRAPGNLEQIRASHDVSEIVAILCSEA